MIDHDEFDNAKLRRKTPGSMTNGETPNHEGMTNTQERIRDRFVAIALQWRLIFMDIHKSIQFRHETLVRQELR